MPGSSPQSVASAVYVPGAQRVCCRRRLVSACAPTPARTADRKAGAWGRLPQSHPHQLGSGRGYRLMLSFDTIPHSELLRSVAARIVDRHVLALLQLWLKTPVEETDQNGRRRMSGGKRSKCGTPQGGPLSPMLANRYMNRFLRHWRQQERGKAYQAHVVAYADDFVILSRGHATEALTWTRQVMARLGLTVNEVKTAVRDARQERFDFLGFSFGPHYYRKDGHWYLGASPSRKSVQRFKDQVGELLVPSNTAPRGEVRDRLNQQLRGWANYFAYGTRLMAYRAVDNHVRAVVRGFLTRRHKVPTRGTRRFTDKVVFEELGVLRLRRVHIGAPPTTAR